MKKLLLLLSTCAVGLVLAGGVGAASQGADRGSFAFDSEVFVPCADGGAGEYVELTGSLNFVFHSTFDKSGGAHLQLRSNLQAVSGVGMTTGAKYRASDSEVFVYNGDLSDAPFTTTTISSFNIIGQGKGNNFVLHEAAHFTISANGDTTAQHDYFSVDCK
jgi:hypothetical protein